MTNPMPLPAGAELLSTDGSALFVIARRVHWSREAEVYEAGHYSAGLAERGEGGDEGSVIAGPPKEPFRVAIKIAKEGGADILLEAERQTRAFARTDRRCVAPVIATGTFDGQSFMVTPWYETLDAWLARTERRPDFRTRLELFSGLARVVLRLQRSGDGSSVFVHADLKPENVAVTVEGHPLLIDFGSAREHGPEDRTTPPQLTPAYSPPGASDATTRRSYLDGYGLAAMLYLALVGVLPTCCTSGRKEWEANGSRDFAKLRKHLEQDLVELRAVGELAYAGSPWRDGLVEELANLIREGLEPDPDRADAPREATEGPDGKRMDRWLVSAPTRLSALADGNLMGEGTGAGLKADVFRIVRRVQALPAIRRLALHRWEPIPGAKNGTAARGSAAPDRVPEAAVSPAGPDESRPANVTPEGVDPAVPGWFERLFLGFWEGALGAGFGQLAGSLVGLGAAAAWLSLTDHSRLSGPDEDRFLLPVVITLGIVSGLVGIWGGLTHRTRWGYFRRVGVLAVVWPAIGLTTSAFLWLGGPHDNLFVEFTKGWSHGGRLALCVTVLAGWVGVLWMQGPTRLAREAFGLMSPRAWFRAIFDEAPSAGPGRDPTGSHVPVHSAPPDANRAPPPGRHPDWLLGIKKALRSLKDLGIAPLLGPLYWLSLLGNGRAPGIFFWSGATPRQMTGSAGPRGPEGVFPFFSFAGTFVWLFGLVGPAYACFNLVALRLAEWGSGESVPVPMPFGTFDNPFNLDHPHGWGDQHPYLGAAILVAWTVPAGLATGAIPLGLLAAGKFLAAAIYFAAIFAISLLEAGGLISGLRKRYPRQVGIGLRQFVVVASCYFAERIALPLAIVFPVLFVLLKRAVAYRVLVGSEQRAGPAELLESRGLAELPRRDLAAWDRGRYDLGPLHYPWNDPSEPRADGEWRGDGIYRVLASPDAQGIGSAIAADLEGSHDWSDSELNIAEDDGCLVVEQRKTWGTLIRRLVIGRRDEDGAWVVWQRWRA